MSSTPPEILEAINRVRDLRTEQTQVEALMKLLAQNAETSVKVANIEYTLRDMSTKILDAQKSTEDRVRKLEDWRNETKGAWKTIAALGAAIGSLFGGIGSYVASHWKGN